MAVPSEDWGPYLRLAIAVTHADAGLVAVFDGRSVLVTHVIGMVLGTYDDAAMTIAGRLVAHEPMVTIADATHDPHIARLRIVRGPRGIRGLCAVRLDASNGLPLGTLAIATRAVRHFDDLERGEVGIIGRALADRLETLWNARRRAATSADHAALGESSPVARTERPDTSNPNRC